MLDPLNLLLKNSAKVTIGGVSGERDGSSGVLMKQEGGRGKGRLNLLKSSVHGRCPGERARITG